jgi:hypothetical protein
MSRIEGLLLGVLLAIAPGCSNDVEMPTPYHRDYLAQPTDVEASVDGDMVQVSWQIASAENVATFVLSFTDPTGSVQTRSVADPAARSYEDASLNIESGSIYLVQVQAVDQDNFFGPSSAADSLLVP